MRLWPRTRPARKLAITGATVPDRRILLVLFSTECPFDGGYDMSVGTSERGNPLSTLLENGNPSCIEPSWKHLLLVFGGVSGLEAALSADCEL